MSSPSSFSTSHPRPWEDKNPAVAGILAFLVPGAGHIYQGRTVKGLIYSFCILGLFFWGNKLGEGMVVYNTPDRTAPWPIRNIALSYAAQLGAGAAALPPLLQNRRAANDNPVIRKLTGPITAPFEGTLEPAESPESGLLVGTVKLEPLEGQFGVVDVHGTFEGTLDGKPVKLELGGSRFELDRRIKAGFRRRLDCSVIDPDAKSNSIPQWISGAIPRSFVDGYGAPPDPEQLQEINGRLGKIYELALVFTWIAGLLNILAIWDCVLGPAYGFGDEHLLAKDAASQSAQTSGTVPPPVAETAHGTSKEDPPLAENRPAQRSPV